MELATAKTKLPPGEDEVAAEKLAAEREGLFAGDKTATTRSFRGEERGNGR
ncbi:ABC transporter permease [Sesbania bispinosa]|nr:ABC transporter permease [Sesbania bispinosa]